MLETLGSCRRRGNRGTLSVKCFWQRRIEVALLTGSGKTELKSRESTRAHLDECLKELFEALAEPSFPIYHIYTNR